MTVGASIEKSPLLSRRLLLHAGALAGGLIIGVGMRQAWRMTGAPTLMIFGPYRVGTTLTATTP